ncbi:hypothetical protein [Amycolatopsis circi]|uniref:hypothetical protein n=1 Tax=Amycolatopsis circi TaxID=871959 RepID=UPI000E23B1C9|nr:hypothetical protein [Amycolatopsis circi]
MEMKQDSAQFGESGFPFEIAVQTTGLQGGDASHGGYVEVTVTDHDGFAVAAKPSQQTGEVVRLRASGDLEMLALADGLEWAGRRLRELIGSEHATSGQEPPW